MKNCDKYSLDGIDSSQTLVFQADSLNTLRCSCTCSKSQLSDNGYLPKYLRLIFLEDRNLATQLAACSTIAGCGHIDKIVSRHSYITAITKEILFKPCAIFLST